MLEVSFRSVNRMLQLQLKSPALSKASILTVNMEFTFTNSEI